MPFARFASVAFATPVLALALLLACGWVGGSLTAGLLASAFLVGMPAVAIWLWVRSGYLEDRFVADRRKRTPLALVSIAAGILALVAAVLVSAPPMVFAGVIAIVIAVVVVGVVSAWWKVSAHSTMAALVLVAACSWSPWGITLVAVVIAVGASRVILRAHSMFQVVVGVLLGAVIGWLCFFALGT